MTHFPHLTKILDLLHWSNTRLTPVTQSQLSSLQRPYRIPLAKRLTAEAEINDMAERGVIEPSFSPWCSNVVIVTKKDGSVRFCLDFRKLNACTFKDSQPLPRIDDTLDALSGATWFSTLDCKSGYWQVGLAEKDRPKTAFSIAGGGLWQFTVMPFGLCNAPATFERLMEQVLHGLSWKQCLVFLDDIIVFSKTFSEHLDILREVFNRLNCFYSLVFNVSAAGLYQENKNSNLFTLLSQSVHNPQ